VVFFNTHCQGSLHYEFNPEGKTVNKDMYINILHHLGDVVSRKCPKKWKAKVAVSSLQCSSSSVSFGQEILSKEQYDNTEASPLLS
jgi:hypothetical protein